jgi:hypothetical protein
VNIAMWSSKRLGFFVVHQVLRISRLISDLIFAQV